jgi:hypothetical protein
MSKELKKVYEMMAKLSPEFKLNGADTFGNTFKSTFNTVTTGIDSATNKVKDAVSNTITKKIGAEEDEAGNYKLETYGDLKKAISVILTKQKASKISGVAVDAMLSLIPFHDASKSVVGFLSGAINKPDTAKTNTWIDKLDIDDDTSKIIDDTVENGFLDYMAKKIENTPDETPLEQNFNMNDQLAEYLKTQYNNRTVVGYK